MSVPYLFLTLPVLAMVLASVLAPPVRRLAVAIGAIDRPAARKVHVVAIPRLGGIVVFGAVGLALLAGVLGGDLGAVFGAQASVAWPLLACGAALVVVLGAVDDRYVLGAGHKLVVQILAAALVVGSGCIVREVPMPGGGMLPLGWLAVPVTMLWVLGVTNALNLIDGLDGLAAGVALIVAGTLGLVSLSVGRLDTALVGFVLAGALGGFLVFNFNPASIFLGDSGSLLLGYVLAVLGIESAHQGTAATFLLTPIVALGLPIGDMLLAIGRRLARALRVRRDGAPTSLGRVVRAVVRADREHIHHWLIGVGLTHRRAVIVLYAVCVVLNLTAILIMRAEATEATTMLMMVAVAVFLGVRRLGGQPTLAARGPRPHLRQAVADAVALVASYASAAWTGVMARAQPAAVGPILQDAVAAGALTVIVLLVVGAYAPGDTGTLGTTSRLLAGLAGALAVAMAGLWLVGVSPPGLTVMFQHALVASVALVATRWVRRRRTVRANDAPSAGAAAGRLRVLQVGKFFHPHRGGIETYVQALATGLAEDPAMDVAVLVANTRARTVRETVDGIPVVRCASLGRLRSLPLTPLLPWHLATARADVVHLHVPNPIAELAVLAVPWVRRARLVVTWHADVVRQRLLARLWGPVSRRLLARADAICVATPAHVSASRHLPAWTEKIHCCPFGVDPDAAHADPAVVQGLRERFGPRPIVLAVGRLVYYKGFDVLLEAVRPLDVTVLLVGDGPLHAALAERSAALGLAGRVHLLGEQEDLAPYFAVCDVFVLPSTHPSEAFGIVQLEAMAFGKPVVSTRLGTGVDWVNRHGESGLVVAPGDATALREAIAFLVANPVERNLLGARGARRLRREFTAAAAIDAVRAVYRRVTGRSEPPAAAPSAGTADARRHGPPPSPVSHVE